MKKIMLLHTVKSVFETFGHDMCNYLDFPVQTDSILDTFLADDPARHDGVFSEANRIRLFHDLENAQLAEPDLIVVTCSSLSPYIPSLRSFFRIPIVSIDDAMCRTAVETGTEVAVIATATSALQPAIRKLNLMAAEADTRLNVSSFCNPDAIAALKAGDRATHDRLVLEMAAKIKSDTDVIVLAQASLAPMKESVEKTTGIRTLASPELCFGEIKSILTEQVKA